MSLGRSITIGKLETRALAGTFTLLAVVVVGALVARHLQPPSARLSPDTIANVEELVAQFDELMFKNEVRPPTHDPNIVSKWHRPIHIFLDGEEAAFYGPPLMKQVRRLSVLTGLGMTIAHRPFRRVNVRIRFGQQAQIFDAVYEFERYPGSYRTHFESSACVTIPIIGEDKDIIAGFIFVSIDYDRNFIRRCLVHELVHLLGFSGHSDFVRPSTMSLEDRQQDLSINDKIVIRTLYDDRIKPGMPRRLALDVARRVIIELADKVRRGGSDALNQAPKAVR